MDVNEKRDALGEVQRLREALTALDGGATVNGVRLAVGEGAVVMMIAGDAAQEKLRECLKSIAQDRIDALNVDITA